MKRPFYLCLMRIVIIALLLLILGCGSRPEPHPEAGPEITDKKPAPGKNIPTTSDSADPYQRWLMNEYDIFNYLSTNPSADNVIQTLGEPDSIFVDFEHTMRIFYYYIPKLKDYNSIEIDPATGQVAGFEWD